MKVALVTGGSRGIGRAIVEEFGGAGYSVAFTYSRNAEMATELVERIRSGGGQACAYQADARDFHRANDVVQQVQRDLGPVTVLINNAGIKRDGVFVLMDSAAWNEVIDTNLGGTFNYTRAVMHDFMRRGGAVINVTSLSGSVGMAGQTSYSASKAAIIGLTKSLAKEVARFGVRVNAIAPGFIDTDMTASMDADTRKKHVSAIPLRRQGCPREVARVARFLAEDGGTYVTGQVWTVDGGFL